MPVRPLIPLTPPRFPAGLFFCERPRAAIRRVVRIGPDRAVESHHTRRPTDAAARATSGSSSSRFGLSQKDGLPFPRCRQERLTVQGHQREHRGDSLCRGRPEFSVAQAGLLIFDTVAIPWWPAHRSRLTALWSVSSHSVRNKRHAAQEARLGVGLDGRGSSVGRNAADLQGALHCSSASLLELKAPWEVEVTRGLASPSRPGGLNRGWPGKSYRNAAGWPKHIERTGCRK